MELKLSNRCQSVTWRAEKDLFTLVTHTVQIINRGKTKTYKKYSQSPLVIQVLAELDRGQSSQSVAPVLWRLNVRGQVDVEDLLHVGRRRLGGAVHPGVAVSVALAQVSRCVLGLQRPDGPRLRWARGRARGRGLGPRLDVLEVLQAHPLPALRRARQQQHGDVSAEPGAHAEVDERVVEAGGLGKEARDDAGRARHVETPGWPHRHHRIWRPGQDESRADYNGNLEAEHEGTIDATEVYYWGGNFKVLFVTWTKRLLVSHPCDVSLQLPLTGCEEAVGWHGVGAFHLVDNGDVGEEHDHHRDEKAKDEDGDDVGLVDGRVISFGPVHLTGTVTPIYMR